MLPTSILRLLFVSLLLVVLFVGSSSAASPQQHIRSGSSESHAVEPTESWTSRFRRLFFCDDEEELDLNANETGAEIFLITFDDNDNENVAPDLDNLNITKITKFNGITGDPRNRYIWSSTLDASDNLFLGTMNVKFVEANVTDYIISVLRAPFLQKFDAIVDALLRQWSGAPIFESQGGEIYSYNQGTSEFDLLFKAPKEFVGFRQMVTYQGSVYAGSTNGPKGPFNGDPYDFDELYKEGQTGAKVFTNAGGEFQQLEDEGYLDQYDKSIRSMCVSTYSNRLFVGTETHKCAKILVYENTTTAGTKQQQSKWKQIPIGDDDCTLSISQCLNLGDGKILFGTWAPLGYHVYLLDETDNDSLAELNTPNYLFHGSCGVMELRVFKDYLYVGILSFIRGFALIRTPYSADTLTSRQEGDWELITEDGFQQEQNEQLGSQLSDNDYPWSSAEVNGVYFIGTFAGSSGGARGQFWATTDGLDWKVIPSEVFDEPPSMYGFRTMEVTSDKKHLYIGSAASLYIPLE